MGLCGREGNEPGCRMNQHSITYLVDGWKRDPEVSPIGSDEEESEEESESSEECLVDDGAVDEGSDYDGCFRIEH